MLHSYAFANFRSFRKRVEVPFTLTEKDSVNGWDRLSPISEQRLTTAVAVLGANASGKTSLIQPLAFLAWFIRYSFNATPDSGVPVVPHFEGRDAPSEFEVVADSIEEGAILRYRLSVNTTRVLSESLEQKVRRGAWHVVFDRQLAKDGKYSVVQDGLGLDQAQAEAARPNVSLISWAAQFGVSRAQQFANFVLVTNMNATGRSWQPSNEAIGHCAKYFAENPITQQQMRTLLGNWDFGLSDVMFQQLEVPSATGEKKKEWFAYGVHRGHEHESHLLPFWEESSGTKTAFALLALFLEVLKEGGVIAYDELDSDLHPHMLEPLLELFSNKKTNPHNAQIIFTTHVVEVLRLLQKSQIMLVEKDGLNSEAWRLDEVEGVRSDENRVSKYLAGAYGAVPRL